jgi:hypothetical protein
VLFGVLYNFGFIGYSIFEKVRNFHHQQHSILLSVHTATRTQVNQTA